MKAPVPGDEHIVVGYDSINGAATLSCSIAIYL